MNTPRPTLKEIYNWPATVGVTEAAAALGISRASAYEAIKNGSFPIKVIRVGTRIVVPTRSLIALLDPEGTP